MIGGILHSWIFAGDSGSAPSAPGAQIARVHTICWVNDIPVESRGVHLDTPDGFWDDRSRSTGTTTAAPGRTGGHLSSIAGSSERELALQGHVLHVPLAAIPDVTAQLTEWMSGLVEVRWAHAQHRVLRGEVISCSVRPAARRKSFARPLDTTLEVNVTIRCRDTAYYSVAPQRLALSTTARAVPVGTLAVGGEIWLNGPIAAPLDVLLYGPHGAPIANIALRDAPGDELDVDTGEALCLRLDVPRAVLRYRADGTVTNHLAWWNAALSSPAFLTALPVGARASAPVLVRTSSGTGVWILPQAWAH